MRETLDLLDETERLLRELLIATSELIGVGDVVDEGERDIGRTIEQDSSP